MTKVLVPVDGSAPSSLASQWAAQFAAQNGGSVTLLHVYDITATEAVGLASLSTQQIKEIKAQVSSASFAAAKAMIGDFDVLTANTTGDPADEIIAYVKAHDIDHIVMGSRGMSPVRELLLGSVSDKTIRHAPCPVTIVR